MTYEERQQAICKECGIHDERCAYFTRNMQDYCPKITSRMVGWELGYKDAIDKAYRWLLEQMFELNEGGEIYVADADASSIKEFMDNFKQAMEEQE